MRDSFAWLEKQFNHLNETQDQQQMDALLKQLEVFVNKYRDEIETEEQIIIAKALEYQMMLYLMSNQQVEVEQIERILNKEFYGIHKIGKPLNVSPDAPNTSGKLNLSSDLLDLNRLKRFAIKQKGTTKPKLLGWALKTIGLIFIGLAAWLFSLKWIWTPLIVGIIGVILSTIGSQVTNIVHRFFSTVTFNLGTIIPGIIIKVEKNNYQATFLAPLMKRKDQATRWGVKTISFNRLAGDFKEGDLLAGVCLFSQGEGEYYQDFIPTPVCLGYRNEVISCKAQQVIKESEWQSLKKIINNDKDEIIDMLVIDSDLQKIG